MEAQLVSSFAALGPPGLIIGALFSFCYYLIRVHKEERKEWIEAYKEATKMMDTRQAETNSVLLNLVSSYRLLTERSSKRSTDEK